MSEDPAGGLERLDWDTAFFGFPIGRLVSAPRNAECFRAAMREARELGLRLFYAYLDPAGDCARSNDAAVVASHLTDHQVFRRDDLTQFVPRGFEIAAGYSIESYPRGEPTAALVQLAIDAGRYSRFRLDRRFTAEDCDRLYREWMTRSTWREMARDVIVLRDDGGRTVGFVTIADEALASDASIKLIAVDPEHRGRGLGRTLVQAATVRAAEAGKSGLTVVTQSCNVEAVNLYRRTGLRLSRVDQVHHVWIED